MRYADTQELVQSAPAVGTVTPVVGGGDGQEAVAEVEAPGLTDVFCYKQKVGRAVRVSPNDASAKSLSHFFIFWFWCVSLSH